MRSETLSHMYSNIAVIGLGRSGRSAFTLLQHLGAKKVSTLDESGPADFQSGTDLVTQVKPDLLVVSPGVFLGKEWIQKFRRSGGAITSEVSLAAQFLESETVIGVTGSMGKSTVSALLQLGLAAAGESVFLGGNFGTPLAEYILEVLQGKRERARFVVLELSSFQLENCTELQLDAAVITAFAPNHLERYASENHYYETKWSIVERTRRVVFINGGDKKLSAFSQTHEVPHSLQKVIVDMQHKKSEIWSKAKLLGEHNRRNLDLANVVLENFLPNISHDKALNEFPGLPHRMQNLGQFKNRTFINDSKATNIEAVEASIASLAFDSDRLILLLGGRDKNLPWEQLRAAVKQVKLVCTFGEFRQQIASRLGLNCQEYDTLEQLVENIFQVSESGDTILLSPGGTSLDEFSSFEDRGEKFRRWIENASQK